MTASRQQCAQATVFLTLYQQAIKTLKYLQDQILRQSAANNVDWKHYFGFRDKFVNIREKTSIDRLRQIIQNPSVQVKVKQLDAETVKNIEYMRFNYYVFLKHLPEYQGFKGGVKDLIGLLKKGNESLRNDLEKTKGLQLTNQ